MDSAYSMHKCIQACAFCSCAQLSGLVYEVVDRWNNAHDYIIFCLAAICWLKCEALWTDCKIHCLGSKLDRVVYPKMRAPHYILSCPRCVHNRDWGSTVMHEVKQSCCSKLSPLSLHASMTHTLWWPCNSYGEKPYLALNWAHHSTMLAMDMRWSHLTKVVHISPMVNE